MLYKKVTKNGYILSINRCVESYVLTMVSPYGYVIINMDFYNLEPLIAIADSIVKEYGGEKPEETFGIFPCVVFNIDFLEHHIAHHTVEKLLIRANRLKKDRKDFIYKTLDESEKILFSYLMRKGLTTSYEENGNLYYKVTPELLERIKKIYEKTSELL